MSFLILILNVASWSELDVGNPSSSAGHFGHFARVTEPKWISPSLNQNDFASMALSRARGGFFAAELINTITFQVIRVAENFPMIRPDSLSCPRERRPHVPSHASITRSLILAWCFVCRGPIEALCGQQKTEEVLATGPTSVLGFLPCFVKQNVDLVSMSKPAAFPLSGLPQCLSREKFYS